MNGRPDIPSVMISSIGEEEEEEDEDGNEHRSAEP